MGFELELQDIEKFLECAIIVEGRKDVKALKNLGFEKVFELNIKGFSLRERVEQIALEIKKEDKVCILTDFDKRGKKMYEYVKTVGHELGFKIDSGLRRLLLNAGVSHVEGLDSFIDNESE